jgi:multidrug efflux pump
VFPPPPVQAWAPSAASRCRSRTAPPGYDALYNATNAFMAKARATPELAGVFTSYQINVPQLDVPLDRTKAKQLGVPVTDVFDTLQIYRLAVRERLQPVRPYLSGAVQADAQFRRTPRTSCS